MKIVIHAPKQQMSACVIRFGKNMYFIHICCTIMYSTMDKQREMNV